jgi:hypothetical protein
MSSEAAVWAWGRTRRPYRDNSAMPLRFVLLTLLLALLAAAPAGAASLASRPGIAAAKRWGAARDGVVAFAVVGERGRPVGLRPRTRFASASLSKAMLLVGALRRARGRRVTAAERALLEPMVTRSANKAGTAVYELMGGRPQMLAVARAAGMRSFVDVGFWSDAQVTAADQARLFWRIDRLVPRGHRAYARRLLSSVVAGQRWGIAPVAARRGARVFFKGGWRPDVVHQAALIERGRHRAGLAVLTRDAPSQAYARATIAGIAERVLRPRPAPFARAGFRPFAEGIPDG